MCLASHSLHCVISGKDSVCYKPEIDKRGLVTIAQLGMLCSSSGIFHNGNLESLFEQLTQMTFYA